jgi:hypothetical protein
VKLPRTFDAPTARWFRAALRRPAPFASVRVKRDHAKVVQWMRRQGVVVATADIVGLWGPESSRTTGGTMRGHNVVILGHHVHPDRKRLFLALHEAGHVIQYAMGFRTPARMKVRKGRYVFLKRDDEHTRSETMAYLLGTALAENLRIKLDQRAWRAFNWEARRDKRRKR